MNDAKSSCQKTVFYVNFATFYLMKYLVMIIPMIFYFLCFVIQSAVKATFKALNQAQAEQGPLEPVTSSNLAQRRKLKKLSSTTI